MFGLENLCNLLFELSSEDRLRILHQLNKEAMNVTNLSKMLGLTIQESSRHVSRLGEVGLTQKDIDGLHHISPYGKSILKQLPGLEFTLQHRDYFTTHSLERFPPEFVSRLGDLTDSTYTDEVMAVFHTVETGMQEAEEYIWAIVDQYLMSTVPLARDAVERGVKIKVIEPEDWVAPPEFYRMRENAEEQWASRARKAGLLEDRVLEGIQVFLYMSEKEVSALAFPTIEGKFDYLGFSATDEQAHKWCRDLFQFYWEKAELRRGFIFE